jgi:hypothetical protein
LLTNGFSFQWGCFIPLIIASCYYDPILRMLVNTVVYWNFLLYSRKTIQVFMYSSLIVSTSSISIHTSILHLFAVRALHSSNTSFLLSYFENIQWILCYFNIYLVLQEVDSSLHVVKFDSICFCN